MADFDQRQLLTNALPLLAVVLMASGILIKTLPLESKRPVNQERAKISHAGRQDVEARLWQDPFAAMRDITGKTPAKRCKSAIEDAAHYPSTLTNSIRHVQERRKEGVTALPVFVPGGPYFEDGESRRRARYAVIMSLFRDGWVPLEEGKLGFVWTFDSCVEAPWARQLPELLPYEWFRKEDDGKALLILWIDEDAVERAPLRGMEALAGLLKHGGVECRLAVEAGNTFGRPRNDLARFLADRGLCVVDSTNYAAKETGDPLTVQMTSREARRQAVNATMQIMARQMIDANVGDCGPPDADPPTCKMIPVRMLCQGNCETAHAAHHEMPWVRTAVIGPWSSTTLHELIQELAREVVSKKQSQVSNLSSAGPSPPETAPRLRFYSSGATATLNDESFCKAIEKEQGRGRAQARDDEQPRNVDLAKPACPSILSKRLEEEFGRRLVRLTTNDAQHTSALVKELQRRLVDATPFRRIASLVSGKKALCDDTVVIVAEGDTSYARDFLDEFRRQLRPKASEESPVEKPVQCGDKESVTVEQVSYLRGLDGVLPTSTGAPARAESQRRDGRLGPQDILLEQTALERADGPSQYDYLRRLAARLDDLDRSERDAHRNGVAAIGVLGNDTYDKILVLDALRDRFPKAVFFAADLDARLLGGGAVRSTRNVVVASGFGLSLQPGLQRNTPPFRDTYQTGAYLSTLVALDPLASTLRTKDFEPWFVKARMFEIGRTRPVNLIPPDVDSPPNAESSDPNKCERPLPSECKTVHASADWRGFDPLPREPLTIALLAIALAAAPLAFLLSRTARQAMRAVWFNASLSGVGALLATAILLPVGLCLIRQDVLSDDGEPFAWFEGVSIWPTQILRLLILILTVALLVYGRWRLHKNIDDVANAFHFTKLSEREATPSPEPRHGVWARAKWLWRLGSGDYLVGANDRDAGDPWLAYIDRMRFRPSVKRIAITTFLFFVFAIALISLDWPYSPHRGVGAAWFNHVLEFVLLGAVMALLFATLDSSTMATRFLANLYPANPFPRGSEPFIQSVAVSYPVSDRALGLWTRFRLAVQLASAVNRFVYLPFLALLLLLPARSRVFDSWNFTLPYAALLVIAITLAVRSAMSLRREAAKLKEHVLEELDREADQCEIEAKLALPPRRSKGAANMHVAAESAAGADGNGGDKEVAPEPAPPALQAELLRRITNEIRAVRSGPFRPLSQEPVVRAILLLLGGTGGITTAEFLFLSRG